MLMFDFETFGRNPVSLITQGREAVYCRSTYVFPSPVCLGLCLSLRVTTLAICHQVKE